MQAAENSQTQNFGSVVIKQQLAEKQEWKAVTSHVTRRIRDFFLRYVSYISLRAWDMQPISIPPAFEAKKLDGSKSNDGQYSAAHISF